MPQDNKLANPRQDSRSSAGSGSGLAPLDSKSFNRLEPRQIDALVSSARENARNGVAARGGTAAPTQGNASHRTPNSKPSRSR